MHAYTIRNGEAVPVYEVEGQNGNMRPTNIADMKVFDLVPSVTEVDKQVLVNFVIQNWKLDELAKWCAANSIQDESIEDYVSKALRGGAEKSKTAMDFGTMFHDTAEAYAFDRQCDIPMEVYPFWGPFKDWFDENVEEVICVERPYVCPYFGIGGKLDMIARLKGIGVACVDYKTQSVKTVHLKRGDEKRPVFYDAWVRQLSLYSAMYDIGSRPAEEQKKWAEQTRDEGLSCFAPQCVSVVIDSSGPGLVESKLWEPAKNDWGLSLALQCIKVWQLNNNYKPRHSIL